MNRHQPPAPAEPGPPDEPLIGIRQLAAWLGVSDHAVRKWVTRGPEARAADGTRLTPPILRINGQVRFRPADVRSWLASKEAAA